MIQGYIHMLPLERDFLGQGLARGESLRSMAGVLGRSPSTLSRECRRNRIRSGYSPMLAQARAGVRMRCCRIPPAARVACYWPARAPPETRS
jgi:IS30 family transposase